MEDIRQTGEWAEYLRSCDWVVEKAGGVFAFIKKIPLTPFSMMKVQRFSRKLDFNDLKRLRKKYKVIYTVIEPAQNMEMSWAKFRINRKSFLPTKTIVIDLSKSEKQLWNNLSANAKRILKKDSMIRVVELKEKEGRKRFYEAWKMAARTWLIDEEKFNKLLDAFREKASLWVSEDDEGLLSGILLLSSGDTVNYFQTWTSRRGRNLKSHYNLVWKVILDYKDKGLKWFDFEGVLDERWPQKRWRGFSEFKKKFGGKVVTYPGSFTRWF